MLLKILSVCVEGSGDTVEGRSTRALCFIGDAQKQTDRWQRVWQRGWGKKAAFKRPRLPHVCSFCQNKWKSGYYYLELFMRDYECPRTDGEEPFGYF